MSAAECFEDKEIEAPSLDLLEHADGTKRLSFGSHNQTVEGIGEGRFNRDFETALDVDESADDAQHPRPSRTAAPEGIEQGDDQILSRPARFLLAFEQFEAACGMLDIGRHSTQRGLGLVKGGLPDVQTTDLFAVIDARGTETAVGLRSRRIRIRKPLCPRAQSRNGFRAALLQRCEIDSQAAFLRLAPFPAFALGRPSLEEVLLRPLTALEFAAQRLNDALGRLPFALGIGERLLCCLQSVGGRGGLSADSGELLLFTLERLQIGTPTLACGLQAREPYQLLREAFARQSAARHRAGVTFELEGANIALFRYGAITGRLEGLGRRGDSRTMLLRPGRPLH